MDEYTIVEVTETSARNPGVGLSREISPSVQDDEGTMVEEDDTNGPWQELDVWKRQKKMLDMGYMADISIKVQDQTFRCHKNIIAASSPKLAKMIRNNSNNLQLQNFAPNHFRLLLEIIYVGKADKLDNVDDVLCVAQSSFELQVYSAVAYCAKILGSLIDAKSACQVLDFALKIKDKDLKEACVKVIREQTDEVLKSVSFVNCNVASLQVILSQEIVYAVTELDLFLACARWTETRKNPREALGSALSLIRFRVITSKDFAKNVVLSKLLTVEDEKNLMLYFLTGEWEMPEGFSNRVKKRELFHGKSKIQEEIYLRGKVIGTDIYMTSEQINACPPLRFSVNRDMNLIGVEVWSYREGKNKRDKYTEDVAVTLKDKNGKIIALARFCEEVTFGSYFDVRFSSPVPINANNICILHYTTIIPGVRHYTGERVQQTYKSMNNAEIQVLEKVFSPIVYLIIES